MTHHRSKLIKSESFYERIPDVPSGGLRPPTLDSSVHEFLDRFIAPQKLCHAECIETPVLARHPPRAQGHSLGCVDRFYNAPPFRHAVSNTRQVPRRCNDADVVEDLVVALNLSGKSVQIVAGRLDLPAAQRTIYETQVHSRRAQEHAELRPQAVLGGVLVLGAQLRSESQADVNVKHETEDSRIRWVEWS